MKHSKNAYLRWCTFMAGLFSVLDVFSINLEIKTEIIPTESDNRYNESIVLYDDVYYAMLGSQIQWQILYNDWEADKAIHDSLYVEYIISSINNNSEIQKDTLKNLNDLNAFQAFRNFPSSNEVGSYKILITPIRLTKNDKGEESSVALSESSKEINLNICHKSSYKPESDFTGGETAVYEGVNVTKEVKNEADNSLIGKQRWEFSWKMDGKTSKGEKWSETFSINEVRAEKKLELTATCYAPDGNTIWYEETFSHTYIVYEKPVLSIDLSTTEFSEEGYEHKIMERNGVSYLLEGSNERDITVNIKYDKSKFQLVSVSYDLVSGNGGTKETHETESLNMRHHDAGQYRVEVKNTTWKLVGLTNEVLPKLTNFNYPSRTIFLREKPQMPTVSWDGETVHMWAGDVAAPLKINQFGEANKGGLYIWKVDDAISSDGNNNQWSGSFSCENGQIVDKVVSLNVLYPDPEYSDIVWYDKIYNHTYRVYGAPIVKFSSSDRFDKEAQEYNHFSGESTNIELSIAGGYSANWNYKWTKNKEAIEGNSSTNYSYNVRENKKDTVYCDTVFVEFENRLPNSDVIYTGNLACYVRIWPEATVIVTLSDSIDVIEYRYPNELITELGMYNGFSRKVTVDMYGGYEDNWACRWYKNNTLSGNEVSETDGILSVQGDEEYQIHPQTDITYVCVATNTLPNGTKLSKQYRIKVKVYPEPEVKTVTEQKKYNLLAGVEERDRKKFEVIKSGGYENGWTFTWMANNKIIESAEGSLTHEYVAKNANEKPDTIVHKLVYSNILEGVVGCQGEFEYKVVDYSVPTKSAMNLNYAQDVRQSDVRKFSLSAPMGGNPNGWYYKWRKDNEDITTEWRKWDNKNEGHIREFTMELDDMPKDTKHSENHRYDFIYTNLDGEGNELVAPDKIEFPVTIYQRPRKPAKIVQKGTGKSDLFILMYDDFEQEELEKADILFDFYMEDGEHLYTGKERVIFFQASQNRLRARSLWKYDSGYDCYSDPVGMGIIDDTKAPDYIEAVNTDANIDSHPMSVAIYSMTGEMVKKVEYAMQKDYSETEIQKGLPEGIYILHCISGNQRVVKKVVVK